MIDNLTEAISHAREVANEKRFMEDHWAKQDKEDKWHDKRQSWITECKECAEEHEQLAAWLEELKERREAEKWRPISEPPKEHDYYLVTCEFGVASATDIALFYPDRKGEEQWSLNYVTAWKPLPEPYESEDK